MKFISMKQTLISFTVFLTILLGSCGVADDTAPPNDPPGGSTTFQQDIENATTVPNLILANALTREVLTPLGANAGASLVKRYVTTNGGATTQDGTSWANAWAATNLRNGINTISDATANRVYLVMVAGATYKPDYSATAGTTERDISFGMKNYVAIMGGFDPAGGWDRTGTTIFSGDIGTIGTTTDNSYNVFFHNSITLGNAHLYGVTITNGNANGTGTQRSGGGMYNNASSPVLTRVVFSGNTAVSWGGGMYNNSSSPILTEVVFRNNIAAFGGGMYNDGSSPVLTEVVFSGNSATDGGGMYNAGSSPVLTKVVFSGNNANAGGGMYNNSSLPGPMLTEVVFSGNNATANGGGMYNTTSSPVLTSVVFSGNTATGTGATSGGGGMYNVRSSPVMIGAVFRNNSATVNGGGMLNDNDGRSGPLIVNTIFSANTLSGAGSGTNIAMRRDGNASTTAGAENIRIAGSVLGIGLAQPTNAIVGFNGTAPLNISNHSLANGAVNFGANANLTINGMSFIYPTITSGSSARNLGLYVRKHVNAGATTYYFSETEAVTSWHTGFTSAGGLDGTAVILPTTGTIEDLTATDIAGNARSGRPDAGVYEVR